MAVLDGIIKMKGRPRSGNPDELWRELKDGVYKELEPILRLLFGADCKEAWDNYFYSYWEEYDYTLKMVDLHQITRDSILDYGKQDDELDSRYNYTAGCA